MHLALLTPELPPAPNGIGDYTYYLAQPLAEAGVKTTLLTGPGAFHCPLGCAWDNRAFEFGARVLKTLPQAVSSCKPDWLILQYNPFLYARRGFNPWLVAAVYQAKQAHPGLKLALMAHELFMPPDNLKFAVMGAFQRLQLWVLLGMTEVVFTSIERWAEMIQPWAPQKPILPIPVGSNIPVQLISEDQKRALRRELGIPEDGFILGSFGSAHYGRMQGLVLKTFRHLREAGLPVHLLFIGSGSDELKAACPPQLRPFLHTTGFLEPRQASHHLQVIEVFLAPFLDGISARRTSALSGLAHGLPVLSTVGHATDAYWQQEFPESLVAVSDEAGLTRLALQCAQDEQLRTQWAQKGYELYQKRFTWPAIAGQMLKTLAKYSAS
ncbi:glycosyltransferase family 4 protein [Anthocerotibacter panamensis]|uniref:glycosyltransferase family 4 protein n=1 Tax=Anthocerotibacter panamensis TaxID=2857077 RepID=UPI001C408546|nr:glycosyltransferase family 4 protein [Anthocerotibacter panamensis]